MRLSLLSRITIPLLAAVVGGAGGLGAGCTGDDPSAANGTAPICSGADCDAGTGAPGFEIASGASITLVQGALVQVDITITRTGFDGPITATASSLPAGVAAQPVVVAAGGTTAKLTLSALPNAAQGTTPITVSTSDAEGKIKREKPATLLVRGAPGALDTTFGKAGKVTAKVGTTGLGVKGVIVQADGRTLIAGGSDNDFALTRLALDGTVDTTYGLGGKVTADLRVEGDVASIDYPNAVALAPSGAAIMVGYRQNALSTHAIARFLPTGMLDATFDKDGYAAPMFPLPDWNNNIATGALVQPDGKAVFAGTSMKNNGGHSYAVVARFKDNGALDEGFGTGDSGWFYGQLTADTDDQCEAVTVAPDDKLVAAGTSTAGAVYNVFALRLDPAGKPDTAFGTKGFSPINFATPATPHSVHALPDRRVLLTIENETKIVLARFDALGVADPTFGPAGKVTVDVGAATLSPHSVLDAAGRLVIAAGIGTDRIVVARVTSDGKLDTTFGTGGIVTVTVDAAITPQNVRLAQAPDGRIVVSTNLNSAAPDVIAYRFWQ